MSSNQDEIPTEEKIIEAATKLFIQKGFDGTKTRDIAEEAGLNIASLHYYFRSKEKLFEIVASKAIQELSNKLTQVLGEDLELDEKIQKFVSVYSDFLLDNPYLPLFVLTEAQSNPERFESVMDIKTKLSTLQKQLDQLKEQGAIIDIDIRQFFITLAGLTVFPFIGRSFIQAGGIYDDQGFEEMIEERKKMVPEIMMSYLKKDS